MHDADDSSDDFAARIVSPQQVEIAGPMPRSTPDVKIPGPKRRSKI